MLGLNLVMTPAAANGNARKWIFRVSNESFTYSDNPFIRWDEKAGLQRDAIRSPSATRSKRNGKETGYEKLQERFIA